MADDLIPWASVVYPSKAHVSEPGLNTQTEQDSFAPGGQVRGRDQEVATWDEYSVASVSASSVATRGPMISLMMTTSTLAGAIGSRARQTTLEPPGLRLPLPAVTPPLTIRRRRFQLPAKCVQVATATELAGP